MNEFYSEDENGGRPEIVRFVNYTERRPIEPGNYVVRLKFNPGEYMATWDGNSFFAEKAGRVIVPLSWLEVIPAKKPFDRSLITVTLIPKPGGYYMEVYHPYKKHKIKGDCSDGNLSAVIESRIQQIKSFYDKDI